MTTQYSKSRAISGQTGTSLKLFAINGDTVLYTADTVVERTNAKGEYLATFGEVAVIPAGNYTQIHFSSGGIPLSIGDRTFLGTDGETATERGAVLDSDVTTQLQAIEDGVDAGNNYHVTTLARLGAWAGNGVNTVLGALRAVAAKAAGITPTDISTGTTYNNTLHSLEAASALTLQRSAPILERPPEDTGVITFAWPVSGATITGTVSLNNAEYVAVAGSIAFLRTDGGKYFYTLDYAAEDRPQTNGTARYLFTDGTYTRYVILRITDPGETAALAILQLDWETVTGEVPSRSVLNALRHIRNKWALDGNVKTVYAEDDTTPAYTTTVTADGAGNITADTPN